MLCNFIPKSQESPPQTLSLWYWGGCNSVGLKNRLFANGVQPLLSEIPQVFLWPCTHWIMEYTCCLGRHGRPTWEESCLSYLNTEIWSLVLLTKECHQRSPNRWLTWLCLTYSGRREERLRRGESRRSETIENYARNNESSSKIHDGKSRQQGV